MRRPHLTRLLLGGLALVAALGLLLPRLDLTPGATELQNGLLLDTPRTLNDWPQPLRDQNGAPVQLADLQGGYHLLFFGFANCPDICPNTLLLASRVYRELPEAVRAKLEVVLVSVDPERDSSEKLKGYVEGFHPEFTALSGPHPALESLTGQAGIAYIKVPLDEGYTVDHSAALVLLDPQARIRAYFAPPIKVEALRADLTTIVGG